MKNKKLFAILTLVCFMFTLMPVAAFAANDAYVTVNDEEKDTVEVNEEVALDVVDGEGSYLFFAVDEDGVLDQVTGSAIAFDEVGSYKVYAADATNVAKIDGETITKAAKLDLLMELDSLVEDYAVVEVKASDLEYRIVLDADEVSEGKYEITIDANGGWSEDGEVTATLQKSTDGETWNDVKGADLAFVVAGYVDVVTEDGKTTDRGGDVEFEVVSERAGEYTVVVKYGTKAKAELTVTVVTSKVSEVEAVTVPKAPVDVEQDVQNANVEFKFFDANGAAYTGSIAGEYKIAVIEQPADSDVEGEYTIKVTLENGASATATVKAAEQGEIKAIKFDVMNTPRTVAYGATTQVNKVIAVDAAGVTSKVTEGVEFSASGLAINTFNAAGVLNAKNDDKYIGSKITVMAVYGDLVATTELTVVDKAATINFGTMTAEAGLTAEYVGTVVDAEGKGSSIAAYSPAAKALVLDKPENAVAVVDATMNAKGQVVLSFLASEEGEYKVQTIVTYSGNTYVTSIDTITVGAGVGTFKDVVVMSIGANNIVVNSDVKAIAAAPMIQDNRTFVPFRALAEAFGANVEWVEATQSVVAELNGVKVVMVIGANDYTVNGVAKTADVAPFINGASTMVPVRFVAEAFGINVTPIYAENGAVADVLFAK